MEKHDQSFPIAFAERMQKMLGDAYRPFMEALQTESPTTVRLNPLKMKSMDESPFLAPLLLDGVRWCTSGHYLTQRPLFTSDPQFHAGAYYVQEASSMFLAHVLRQILPSRPIRVLDLCAAPGGKTTLAASMLPDDSLLVSNEVIRSRAGILRENVVKWGQDNVVVTNNDPSDFTALRGAFDVVIVDAPCSGEGMFRKDARAVSEWSERNLQICADRQRRILADVWDALAPDGYLIYSTCTFNPAENEEMVAWACSSLNAEYVPVKHDFEEIMDTEYGYRFYPHKTQGEGLFMALLHKKEGDEFVEKQQKTKCKEKTPVLPAEILPWLPSMEKYTVFEHENRLTLFPVSHASFFRQLESRLHILHKGCEAVEVIGKKCRPQQALALFGKLNKVHTYEVDMEMALRYLKKEAIPAAPSGDWVLVTYGNVALGWGKNVGNRLNNYFPKEWRIRMDIDDLI